MNEQYKDQRKIESSMYNICMSIIFKLSIINSVINMYYEKVETDDKSIGSVFRPLVILS